MNLGTFTECWREEANEPPWSCTQNCFQYVLCLCALLRKRSQTNLLNILERQAEWKILMIVISPESNFFFFFENKH